MAKTDPPWYDFDSRGCPLCGKSLVFDHYERPRGPFAHMTCGGLARHRFLVYRRGPRIGWRWTRMRLLKNRTNPLW